MKLKRIIIFCAFLIGGSFYCFAASVPKVDLPSRHSEARSIYPVDSAVGQVSNPPSSENLQTLNDALKSEFDFDWTEKYLHPETKAAVSKIVSEQFPELLPCDDFVLSKEVVNSDSSISISAHFIRKDIVVSFILKDGLIFAAKFQN